MVFRHQAQGPVDQTTLDEKHPSRGFSAVKNVTPSPTLPPPQKHQNRFTGLTESPGKSSWAALLRDETHRGNVWRYYFNCSKFWLYRFFTWSNLFSRQTFYFNIIAYYLPVFSASIFLHCFELKNKQTNMKQMQKQHKFTSFNQTLF